MKPSLLAFPAPEFNRINYSEEFVIERLQLLKKARQNVLEESMVAGDSYKRDLDAMHNLHYFKEGDYAYPDNQLFLGKNKKFARRWIGPYLVTKVNNDQNIELQISHTRKQVHSAYRLKKLLTRQNPNS
jgi:hypothetical protein